MPARTRRWDRSYHEETAIEEIEAAKRHLRGAYGCSSEAVYAAVRANRMIAHARTHLVSIGPSDGKRTRRIWGALGKIENAVNEANNKLATCLRSRE